MMNNTILGCKKKEEVKFTCISKEVEEKRGWDEEEKGG